MTSALDRALRRAEVTATIATCTRCDALRVDGEGPIPFAGLAPAPILVMVEQPGVENDEARGWVKMGRVPGSPVQPASPQVSMLFRGLDRAGITRDKVAICGAVQCARGLTRGKPDPVLAHHLTACAPVRKSIIELVNPAWIVACGATAAKVLIPTKIKVGRDHGKWWRGTVGPAMDRRVFITYHPQAGYRDERAERHFTDDLRALGRMMGGDTREIAQREMGVQWG